MFRWKDRGCHGIVLILQCKQEFKSVSDHFIKIWLESFLVVMVRLQHFYVGNTSKVKGQSIHCPQGLLEDLDCHGRVLTLL